MIGSPDLLAFTNETEFSQTTSPDLPEEFSIPYSELTSSWSRPSTLRFYRDFILISEFSEQVGPQPLLTIPDKTRSHGPSEPHQFDLNQFSVRIMSVDYQTVLAGPSACVHPRLNFVEDSAVVLEYPQEGAFAYVHYLTLYDLEARGFVRPFCMAYVSSEEKKIMQSFRRLSREFSKASECLKTGNRKNFASEIDKRLADLEYTRSVQLRETSTGHERNVEEEVKTKEVVTNPKKKVENNNAILESDGAEEESDIGKSEGFKKLKETKEGQNKAAELAGLDKAIQEHRSLLRQVTSFPSRKLRNQAFLPYDSESLSDSDVQHVRTPDTMVESRTCSHTPRLISSNLHRHFDKRLKNLEELCDEYFLEQTLKQLRSTEKSFRGDASYLLSQDLTQDLLRHLSSTNFLFEYPGESVERQGRREHKLTRAQSHPSQGLPASLELYTSCVETVAIKLRNEASQMEPGVFQAFPSTPNKDETVPASMKDSVSSGESIEVLGTEKFFRTASFHYATEAVPLRSACSPGVPEVRKRRVTTRRENSEDSIEVLSTTDSIIPDDLRASYFSAIHEETQETQEPEDALPTESQDDPQDVLNSSDPDKNLDLNYLDFRSISRANSFQPAQDTRSECFSSLVSTVSDLSSFQALEGKTASGVSRRTRARSGRAMLHFLRYFPFAVHAVYSLLSGRTLVVMGGDEAEVRRWVTALGICTPQVAREGNGICHWTSEPLQITDLLTWKLIGFNRTSSPSCGMPPCLARYTRYLSILDVDQRTLRCPAYRGSMLAPLAEPSAQITGGTLYFLYARSVLSELVSRAFVLTFSHDLWKAGDPGAKDRAHRFLSRFHQDDLKVLRFLSDLVTRHTTGSAPTSLGCSYSASTVFKL